MYELRKTDKHKLIEGRGIGRLDKYEPFIKVHEVKGSVSRSHRIFGWKTKRVHQFLSDLEFYYFLILQWRDEVIDIREQFPLLPKEDTIMIANALNIRHPSINNTAGSEIVMTTDFVITINNISSLKDIVRTIKPRKELDIRRVLEKLQIEKEYFKRKGIDWGIVTDEQINKVMAQNIYNIYNNYFWIEDNQLLANFINEITGYFIKIFKKNNFEVLSSIFEFEEKYNYMQGKGLNFFKYLISHKFILTDMNILFNYHSMKAWLNPKLGE